MDIHFLEFDELIVVEGSDKYLFGNVQGHRIERGTTIIINDIEFDLDYIMNGEEENLYRLINSNNTLIVELK